MRKQISNVSGHQTSKVFALLYVIFTAPFAIIGVMGMIFSSPVQPGGQGAPWIIFALAPLIYGGMGYVFTRIGCFVYNFIAKRFGGVEFTIKEVEQEG